MCRVWLFCFLCYWSGDPRNLHVLTHSFPTRRSSDLYGILCCSFDQVGVDVGGSHCRMCSGVCGEFCAVCEGDCGRYCTPCCHPRLYQLHVTKPIAGMVVGSIRSEEHTSELQSLMRISYAVLCLKKKNTPKQQSYYHSTY